MNEKLKLKWDDEYGCYDIEIKDPGATVGDFEEVCQDLFSEQEAYRKYSDSCFGCCICCSERIPVTRIDLERIYKSDHGRGNGNEADFRKWAERVASAQKSGECVDVTLQVDYYCICQFWDREKGLCSIYQARPFACRTYLCAPMSRRLEELRSQIINMGQDDLVPHLCQDAPKIYRKKNAFTERESYKDIKLRDICTKRLWRQLVGRSEEK